ncbi:MAG TPA: threonine/serine dehydratase [Candidatus Limnocylindria bacterium]
MLTAADIRNARDRIGSVIHRTPMLRSSSLGELLGGIELQLKAELFQRTGSFKPRGVANKLLSLSDEEKARGFVTISRGNHAQALAYAASAIGVKATVVMAADAVPSKVNATRAYGGEVILTEGDIWELCQQLMEERHLTLVHPFDDEAVMAGQGTVGLEIVEDAPEAETVIVPIGGGGLISGISVAIKDALPGARVIGVEPAASDAMRQALAAGASVQIGNRSTIADGVNAPYAGEHCLPVVQRYVDEVVAVEEDEIVAGLRVLLERSKLAAEPAAATPIAALMAGRISVRPGERVVCLVSGGNLDLQTLKGVL